MERTLTDALAGDAHLLFDGGMGTMLQAAGLVAGEVPELWCLTHADAVTAVHRAYVEAGSDVVTTNTFGANRLKLAGAAAVDDVFAAAVACARAAGARYVAADIGPTGALLRPLGTLSFDEAYDLFAEEARAAARAGADLFIVETMTDLAEAKAAYLACRENTDLPVIVTMTFGEDGRTFLGTSPEVAAVTFDALGADAVGINCSLGPTELLPLAKRMRAVTAKPLLVQANAGLPHVEGDATVYDIGPEAYADAVRALVDAGVDLVGGCCGTTPAYIRLLDRIISNRRPATHTVEPALTVTSAQNLVALPQGAGRIAVIGERINPTGKKRLQEALSAGEIDYVVSLGISQQEEGADILDVNIGLPGIDEAELLPRVVEALCGSVSLPLMLDSSDPLALEAACRRYPGIPIINSVNGSPESLEAILPIAARYGARLVGLTLDEHGLPATAEERLAIARRIVAAAKDAGIAPERLLIDCLALTVSTDQTQAGETLAAIGRVKRELGTYTTLGVSNVSFGLPERPLLNATFLAAALGAGLDAPILNPGSARYCDTVNAYRVLNAQDAGSRRFIERYADWTDPYRAHTAPAPASSGEGAPARRDTGAQVPEPGESALQRLVISGRKGEVAACVRELLAATDPLAVINDELIPALDEVGARFEAGTYFLPQLMASAEAAGAGFDVIRAALPADAAASKGALCLATVKGDIHDIGKNIVRMLLENYGYRVYDLGRDVAPEDVLACVRAHDLKLVGLSALMTTTVKSMQETIELIHREEPEVRVFVGGAVLTAAYARAIGADFYAKDAAASARIAEQVLG
ncbi:homocysteine S-methyltransferase family protein [Collinsella intestinalis]|uniref:homocysteine S-methyltransferase family protein n=1 Tax=Collinsella intestinalis TaxID=147207 RepID=UPI0025A34149|nr:homocysteine S-methyltransferase family protein [Collinsella intestinalis]MDM8163541.1 homocysteine S-methyltransferase family protein [Collinsella intestinalis]